MAETAIPVSGNVNKTVHLLQNASNIGSSRFDVDLIKTLSQRCVPIEKMCCLIVPTCLLSNRAQLNRASAVFYFRFPLSEVQFCKIILK